MSLLEYAHRHTSTGLHRDKRQWSATSRFHLGTRRGGEGYQSVSRSRLGCCLQSTAPGTWLGEAPSLLGFLGGVFPPNWLAANCKALLVVSNRGEGATTAALPGLGSPMGCPVGVDSHPPPLPVIIRRGTRDPASPTPPGSYDVGF